MNRKKTGRKQSVQSSEGSHWMETELAGINLGDPRLERRLIQTACYLADQPQCPINQASPGWKDTKGAYRLFQNSRFDPKDVLAAHHITLKKRLASMGRIFVIQDTTKLDFSRNHATQNLGRIGEIEKSYAQGLVLHASIAVTETAVPVGVFDLDIWARKDSPIARRYIQYTLTDEEKESFKWIRSMRRTQEVLSGFSIEVVHIGDRECDSFNFFQEAQSKGIGFLVRARADRDLEFVPKEPGGSRKERLWEHMRKRPLLGEVEVDIPDEDEPGGFRKARLAVRSSQVKLRWPQAKIHRERKKGNGIPEGLSTNIVWAREIVKGKLKQNKEPVEWMLITNGSVETLAEAFEKVRWYKLRWQVESFFRILKSGCRVEKCRLGEAKRLMRYITIKGIVAWRIHWMTYLNRKSPDESCTQVLENHEWKSLFVTLYPHRSIPAKPPSIHESVRDIARLGGFLARKCDGEPGMTHIWRGWNRLSDIARTWKLRDRHATCG